MNFQGSGTIFNKHLEVQTIQISKKKEYHGLKSDVCIQKRGQPVYIKSISQGVKVKQKWLRLVLWTEHIR